MSHTDGRFQTKIRTYLPSNICAYILQFSGKLIISYIDRYSKKRFYDMEINSCFEDVNEYYLHSSIAATMYPIWRLVSKYYYYMDSNSICNFCNGRYCFFDKKVKCNNCGHINTLKYSTEKWSESYHIRRKKIERLKELYNGFQFKYVRR